MVSQFETAYSSPVDQLLRIGDPREVKEQPDYLARGLGPEHIPELTRMATDENLNNADSDTLEVWAPLHAWRALGKLRAESAAEPLLALFQRADEQHDDWVLDDLPRALGEIGAAGLPALSAYLADRSHGLWARHAAADSITEIGRRHPESRNQCVAALNRQLSKFAKNDSTLNGSLIADLLDLVAVEAAPIMERAFAAGVVDEMAAGDWEDVQIELELREARATSTSRTAIPGFRKMSDSERLGTFLNKLAPLPDLNAVQRAEKKARSQAKKNKWKKVLQRQKAGAKR